MYALFCAAFNIVFGMGMFAGFRRQLDTILKKSLSSNSFQMIFGDAIDNSTSVSKKIYGV